ncbi:GGDEF domain-containing response regulator [Vreelandella massiliensis]|uniref:GGDEF domain-containing response regulator n=1 Tax=Vreelandella massiliensis TaxID=1816686 RepID=UPI0009FB2EB0|nr:diguanylate cyclase [Halomonas massiliensis]MYL22983.1 diguanylate cyclase [Halomonas alkaliantarctica]
MQTLSVLLVEDEPGDAELIRYSLKFSGGQHTVEWVQSLGELRAQLDTAKAPFDVILLDLNLPDASGLETVSRCKAMAPDTPVVVLTGHDDMDFSLKTLEAGAQDYLIKNRLEADALLRAMRYAMERHQLEHRLQQSEELMMAAIEGGDLGVWEWNLKTNACHNSERVLKTCGFSTEDGDLPVSADEWMQRIHPDDMAAFNKALKQHLRGETKRYQNEFRFRHKQGHWIWLFASGHVVSWDREGHPERMVGIQQEITERKAMEQQLRDLAMHDPLTGLLNRRSFMNAMDREYGRVRRHKGYQAGVLMLDIDRFKHVNDTYGHAVGDDILKAFAHVIADHLRENDVFGRLGGEEFAILLPDTDLDGSGYVAEKVRTAIEAMRVEGAGQTIAITTSVGVDRLLAEDERPDGALARADAALYHAKQNGRNRVSHYDKDVKAATGTSTP